MTQPTSDALSDEELEARKILAASLMILGGESPSEVYDAEGYDIWLTSVTRRMLHQALARCERAERRVEELTAACVEIDTYLANDPLVWRIVSVAKAGDVLCDVLGSEVIGAINRSAHCESEHCPYCVPVLVRENAE